MYLNCKTFFSFRYGTFKTDMLVKAGVEAGATAMAITNINNTCDAWDFYEYCLAEKIKPILGAEIRNDGLFCYVLLAKDLEGFREINQFLSDHLQQKAAFPARPAFSAMVWVIYPLGTIEPAELTENELIGVQPSGINRLFAVNTNAHPKKFIVRHPVTFQDKQHFNLHRLLRAIDKNVLLSKQQPAGVADASETFITPAEIFNCYRAYPGILTRTLEVINSCQVELGLGSDKNLKSFTGSKEGDRIFLAKLTQDGLNYRYKDNPRALQRVEKELGIIHEMDFNAYFLITWDIIRYAQSRGFYYVGRGSGANSIVAYCLRITDVDPMELDLYFERFLNPQRKSPPDFDIDFSWKDRDEVIDYVFKRYGKDKVALLGMYSTFQRNAIIRELAKVFGLPKQETDALVDQPNARFAEDGIQRLILKYGKMLEDFPNHLSIHPGGMLISNAPICSYTALELPPKGFNTTQIDMFLAEKVGLSKLDILSQRGLGHIKDCIRLVSENKKIHVDIHDVEKFKTDRQVAAKIRSADTIGCFYIESPAMRHLLMKLRCDDYLTLVAASSIIRPGVAQSGMMRQYIHRFHNPDTFEYLHPKMKELLEETHGVMVYQEDVIKVAHHFAGLDMAEADVLRRAMSGKYRTNHQLIAIRDKFFENCSGFGYDEALTREVWRQIESFGGYSFSKAHSASFAVESYQSLFLKTYYPMEFMVAVINNFGGFYQTELYFHELRKTGASVLPPCVNNGEFLTSIRGTTVYTGFVHVQGIEEKMANRILEERKKRGLFLHLQDLIERTSVTPEQLNILIRIGALRFTGKNKKELLWEANFLQKKNRQHLPAHASLFKEPPVEFSLPSLKQHPHDDALDEIELLGFPLGPVWDLVDVDPRSYSSSADLSASLNKPIELIAYYVTTKPVRTSHGEMMFFGTFLDKNGEWLDTVHFAESARQHPLQGKGFYILKGRVTEEFGVYSVEVTYCRKTGLKGREVR